MTPLVNPLKRSLSVNGEDFVVTLSPESLKLTRKGRRLGVELRWDELVSGESALAVALQASVGKFAEPSTAPKVTVSPPKQSKSPKARRPK